MGDLADRFSTRRVVLVGVVTLGASQLLLSFLQSLWQLYLLYGILVGGLSISAFYVPLVSNIGYWFDRNKGLAIGITLGGQVAGAACVPYLARFLISTMGWRETYLMLGLLAWVVLFPLVFFIRQPPGQSEGSKARPNQIKGAIISHGKLTTVLSSAIIFCCICMAIPLIHVVSRATDVGLADQSAAFVLSLLMIGGLIGRVGSGKVADLIGGVGTLLLASGIQTLTIFWFSQVNDLYGFYSLALLFGVGYGGVMPSYAVIIRELVPSKVSGRSLGIVYCFGNIGMGLGGYFGGLLFDFSGDYTLTFSLGAITGLINLIFIGFLLYYMRAREPGEPIPQAV
jgi:MFS family permease